MLVGGFIHYCEYPVLKQNPKALEAVWDYAYDKVGYFRNKYTNQIVAINVVLKENLNLQNEDLNAQNVETMIQKAAMQ